jgi:uncharacterized protein (TIGR02271 family)
MTQFTQNGSGHEASVDGMVTDAAGQRASIIRMDRDGGNDAANAWLRLADGRQVQLPASLLQRQSDGGYRLPVEFASMVDQADGVQMTFPVMEEQLHVEKRVVDTGRGIRIHKTVDERQQTIDESLLREELSVEHVPVGQILHDGKAPEARYEGETLVLPVLEEVLVVQKQLMLKEEVRITRRRQEVRESQQVALRSEQVHVERFEDELHDEQLDPGQAQVVPPEFRTKPHQSGPAAG